MVLVFSTLFNLMLCTSNDARNIVWHEISELWNPGVNETCCIRWNVRIWLRFRSSPSIQLIGISLNKTTPWRCIGKKWKKILPTRFRSRFWSSRQELCWSVKPPNLSTYTHQLLFLVLTFSQKRQYCLNIEKKCAVITHYLNFCTYFCLNYKLRIIVSAYRLWKNCWANEEAGHVSE